MKRFIILFVLLLSFQNITYAFSDVTGHPYEENIVFIKNKGFVNGYPDGSYQPNNLINRAEFAKIVVGASMNYDPGQDPSGFDIYSLSNIPFSDVEDKAWYIPFLRKAIQNDVINGYPDGTFKPNNNINLAEALKIILLSFNIEISNEISDPWYLPYISWASENGLLMYINNDPAHFITRGEMAELIYRLDMIQNNIANQSDMNFHLAEIQTALGMLINDKRAIEGLTPIDVNGLLNISAQNHAEDMAQNNYLSHESLDGRSMFERVEQTGFQYSLLGENIAQGQQTPEEVIESWMNSPPHRENLLNPSFNSMGIGYAVENDTYWVLVLGQAK